MLELWWQLFLSAGDSDAKLNIALDSEFLLNLGQSQNQV
jgi:hypothetical protein